MNKIIIFASIFIAVSCADEGKKKKKKSPAQSQQTDQQNYSQNTPQPGSADGMLGSVQNQQNQSGQSQQSNANPMSGLLGGLSDPNSPIAGLLKQFMGGGGAGGLDPAMLQSLMGGAGGAGGMDISKLLQMLPQMGGQTGAQSVGLRGDDTDTSYLALVDLLASEYQRTTGIEDKRSYRGVEILCLSAHDVDAFITVNLVGDQQKFYGTRSLTCSKFKVVFPGLEDGDYDLHVAYKSVTDDSQQDIELSVFAQDGQISERLDF